MAAKEAENMKSTEASLERLRAFRESMEFNQATTYEDIIENDNQALY